MEVDGVNVTGSLKIPNTQNWQSYVTVTKTGIVLTGGTHVLKIVFDAGGSGGAVGNLNWFQGTLTTPAAPPAAPTGLTLGPVTSSSVALSWTNVAGSTQSSVRVERKTGVNGAYAALAAAANLSATATSFTDTTAAAGTQYFYHVISSNGQDSPASNEVAATTIAVPIAPNGLTVGTVTINSVALTWANDPASTQTSVRVERKTGANGAYATLPAAATLAATATSFTDNTAAPGVTYFYHVISSNGLNSPASNEVSTTTPLVPPSAPVGLNAIASGTTVTLSWTALASNQSSFRLERKTGVNGTYAAVTGASALSPTATGFVDAGLTPGSQYYYHLIANNSGGDSAPSNEVNVTLVPAAPTGLTATAASPTAIHIAWNTQSTGQTSFRLERKLGANGVYATVTGAAALDPASTSFDDSGLSSSTAYVYRLFAVDAGGASGASVEAGDTTQVAPVPPAAPGSLQVTGVTTTSISLSWAPMSGNTTGYSIQRRTATVGYAIITEASSLPAVPPAFTDTGLSPSTQYFYEVVATNQFGPSVASVEIGGTTATPVAAQPTSLAATVAGTSVSLTWDALSSNQASFRLERKASAGAFGAVAGATALSPTATSFTDAGLAVGTTYTYRLVAVNAGGDSTPSAATSATTIATQPAGLIATTTSGTTINLSWTALNSTQTGFRLERKPGVNGTYATVPGAENLAANAISFGDSGLTNGTQYFYRLIATNAAGDSAASVEASATTLPLPPAAPSGLTAVAASAGSITLSWAPLASNQTSFYLQRKTGAGSFVTITAAGNLGPSVVTFTDTGLAANNSYTYQLVAHNLGGDTAAPVQASATTLAAPPGAPALSLFSVTAATVTLHWTPADPNATGWSLQRKTGAAGAYATVPASLALAGSAGTFTDTGLLPQTQYFYQLLATSSAGSSPASNPIGATTTATTVPLPMTGSAVPVPGKIEAENFDLGGQNIAYFDTSAGNSGNAYRSTDVDIEPTSDTGQGYDVGYVEAGEWMKYSVNVAPTGFYTFDFRVASVGTGANFHMEVDGGNVTGTLSIPNTQGFQNWTDVYATGINLSAGPHVLKLMIDSAAPGGGTGNFNWFAITPMSQNPPAAAPTGLTATAVGSTSVSLQWADSDPTVTSFQIQRKSGVNGTYAPLAAQPVGVNFTWNDTGLVSGGQYFYRVIAINKIGPSVASNEISATTTIPAPPGMPAGFTATSVTSTAITLAWTPAGFNQTGFRLERAVGANGSFGTLAGTAVLGVNAVGYTDSNVTFGQTDSYRLVATNALGDSPYTAVVTRLVPIPPSTPFVNNTPLPLPGKVEAENFDNGGAGIAYNDTDITNAGGAYRSTDVDIQATTDTGAGYNIGWVAQGEWLKYTVNVSTSGYYTFDFRVAALGQGGAFHLEVDGVNATGSLTIPNTSGFQNWTDVVSPAAYVTAGQHLLRLSFDTATPSGNIGNVNWFKVTPAVPPVPTGLTTVAGPVTGAPGVAVSWTQPGGVASNLDGFILQRSTDNATWGTIATLGPAVSSYPDSAVVDGTKYYYRIIATSTFAGNAAPSASTSATTPLAAPSALAAVSPSATVVNLTWTVNSVHQAGFMVQRSTNGGTTWTTLTPTAVTGPAFQDTTVSAGVSYLYRVNAVNSTTASAYSNSAAVIAISNAPTSVSATAAAFNSITLGWSASTGAAAYKVMRSLNGTDGWSQIGAPTALTTFSDITVDESTKYYYEIVATNGSGDSVPSGVKFATTPGNPPAAPGLVQGGAPAIGQIQLAWPANAEPDIAGYNVYRSESPVFAILPANLVAGGVATNAYLDTTAVPLTTYYYEVTAVDTHGNESQPSAATEVTALPGPPSAPIGLVASRFSASQINLTWTDTSTNEDGFEIDRSTDGGLTFTPFDTVGANVTTSLDATVGDGANYDYRVIGVNTLGISLPTNISEASTLETPSAPVPNFPGILEAENFDNGGEGVGYHDLTPGNSLGGYRVNAGVDIEATTDGGAGFDVSNIKAGEWLRYTVNVPLGAGGVYSIEPRVASAGAGGTFHIDVDNGAADTAEYTIPNTGGAQNWQTLSQRLSLSEGVHTLRIVFDSNGAGGTAGSLNYVKFLAPVSNSDLLVKSAGDADYIGGGTLTPDGTGQTVAQTTTGTAVYFVQVQNSGSAADDLTIKGTAGPAYSQVRYYDAAVGGNDITSLVTSSNGWDLGTVAGGDSRIIRVEVTPLTNATGGSVKNVLVTMTSKYDPTHVDVAQLTTTTAITHAVSLVRNNYDVSGHYVLTLKNAGNVSDVLTLSAPSSGTGWTAKYFDAATGGTDITAAVNAGTYPTAALAGRQSVSVRVEITRTVGTVAQVTVTATSTGDPTRSGTVTIVTAQPAAALSQFVIGASNVSVAMLASLHALGINTAVGFNSDGGATTIAQWTAAAQAAGLNMIRQASDDPTADAGLANLLAYMLPSNPDTGAVDPAVFAAQYAALKAINPNLPVFAGFDGNAVLGLTGAVNAATYQAYTASADLIGSAIAPLGQFNRADLISDIGAAEDSLSDASDGKAQYACIETNAPGETASQFTAEVWSAVIHGARGIIYSQTTGLSPEITAAMQTLNATLAQLGNVLASPIAPPIESLTLGSGLEGTWRSYGGKTYFIVLNTTGQTLTGQTVTMNGIDPAATIAAVYNEARTLPLAGGSLTDTFAPLEMHAYVVNNPANPVPTSTQPVGANLDAIVDYSTGDVFINAIKMFRGWAQYLSATNPTSSLTFTPQGLPKQNASALSYLYDYPDGIYHLTYQGQATITFSGFGEQGQPLVAHYDAATDTTTADVALTRGTDSFMVINVSNLSDANPLRNLHMISPDYDVNTTQVFTNAFLKRLQPLQTLRFMDWGVANNSTLVNWTDRTSTDFWSQADGNGVAYEYMINLANTLHKDVWINIPALTMLSTYVPGQPNTTNDYVKQMADLFRDRLDPSLKIHVEYSNEIWNQGSFSQGRNVQVLADGDPTLTATDRFGRAAQEYALQSAYVSQIWQNEFGSRAGQLSGVLGGQAGTTYWAQTGLAYVAATLGAPSNYFSELAIAPYFGNDIGSDNTANLNANTLFTDMNNFVNTTLKQWVIDAKVVANQYALGLSAYEAGQDLFNLVNGTLANTAQNDPRMGLLYQTTLNIWQQNGGGLYNLFDNIGPFWGLLSNQSVLGSVKYNAVLQSIDVLGDASLDGTVGSEDLSILSQNFGQTGKFWEQGDFNGDGTVNFTDFQSMMENFGSKNPF